MNQLVENFHFLDLRPENFKISNPKISGNIHAIPKIQKDSETSAKTPDSFLLLFWLSELHEPPNWKCCLSLKIRENFKFYNPKISGNIHAISKILEDSETSAKMPDPFFLFSDFDRRNLTNELREVFAFLVRAHELLMQNKLLPLISLGLTAWKGLFWISKPIATIELRSTGINGWIALVIDFLWISQCLKARDPILLQLGGES